MVLLARSLGAAPAAAAAATEIYGIGSPRRGVRCAGRVFGHRKSGTLTITSFACDPEALRSRKGVVVSARVHPGESNSSYMMKGLIDYLTGPSLDAKILRDNFVFKIVPKSNGFAAAADVPPPQCASVHASQQSDRLHEAPTTSPRNR